MRINLMKNNNRKVERNRERREFCQAGCREDGSLSGCSLVFSPPLFFRISARVNPLVEEGKETAFLSKQQFSFSK